jgi:hypothetical protein
VLALLPKSSRNSINTEGITMATKQKIRILKAFDYKLIDPVRCRDR